MVCEHCKENISPSRMERHQLICIDNEENAQRLRNKLHELSDDGFICTGYHYHVHCRGTEWPNHRWLAEKFGGWQNVAVWAGLHPDVYKWHLFRQDVKRLAQELHDGKYGPTEGEFELYSQGWVTRSEYRKHLGSWANILEWADLSQGSRAYYNQTRLKRQQELEEKELAQSGRQITVYDGPQGLPAKPPRTEWFADYTKQVWRKAEVYELR